MSVTITQTVEEQTTLEHHEMMQRIHDDIFKYGPEHFDMGHWGATKYLDEGGQELRGLTKDTFNVDDMTKGQVDFKSCGTVGCFVGHIATTCHDLNVNIQTQSFTVYAEDYARVAGIQALAFESVPSAWPERMRTTYEATVIGYLELTELHSNGERILTWEALQQAFYEGLISTDQYNECKQHCEWVTILAYIRYLIGLSHQLHEWEKYSSEALNEDKILTRMGEDAVRIYNCEWFTKHNKTPQSL